MFLLHRGSIFRGSKLLIASPVMNMIKYTLHHVWDHENTLLFPHYCKKHNLEINPEKLNGPHYTHTNNF